MDNQTHHSEQAEGKENPVTKSISKPLTNLQTSPISRLMIANILSEEFDSLELLKTCVSTVLASLRPDLRDSFVKNVIVELKELKKKMKRDRGGRRAIEYTPSSQIKILHGVRN
jgi:hypothetical protein